MPKVIFLGTAGYHPSETRHTVCVFLPEEGIVLDAGTGFFRVIDRVQTESLDIFISHAHLDHTVGITYMIDLLYKNPGVKRVTIHALPEHLDAIRDHLYFKQLFPAPFEWDMRPIEDAFTVGKVTIKTMPLHHKGNATGYRLEFIDGKTLAYITDTEVNESYLPLLQDVDLLIHENNFPDSFKEKAKETKHSSTSEVLSLAKQANVKQVALYHFNPLDTSDDPARLSESREHFENVVQAKDMMEIEF